MSGGLQQPKRQKLGVILPKGISATGRSLGFILLVGQAEVNLGTSMAPDGAEISP